ncbi:uncharacterized protein LOC133654244 isoform X1 [Entelurus aequoreus]|uniref:uncharacterized protein LOC133654244 isoform X1 n=1 Tax=Entelurus aequoreus TaxID=161455 RepID=UPI002B1DA1F1|nr:uncharacterized protein LOC133654244 isoform X1 [Entelurus aequoreus]
MSVGGGNAHQKVACQPAIKTKEEEEDPHFRVVMTSRRDVIFQNGRARGKTPWSRLHFPRKDVNSATCNNYKAEEGYLNTHHSIIINESHVFFNRSGLVPAEVTLARHQNTTDQHDERDILPLDEGHRAATKFAFSYLRVSAVSRAPHLPIFPLDSDCLPRPPHSDLDFWTPLSCPHGPRSDHEPLLLRPSGLVCCHNQHTLTITSGNLYLVNFYT